MDRRRVRKNLLTRLTDTNMRIKNSKGRVSRITIVQRQLDLPLYDSRFRIVNLLESKFPINIIFNKLVAGSSFCDKWLKFNFRLFFYSVKNVYSCHRKKWTNISQWVLPQLNYRNTNDPWYNDRIQTLKSTN